MKLSFDRYGVVDLDAPVLPAYEKTFMGVVRWLVWCRHCQAWHRHGPVEGHREAHCVDPASLHWHTGYNLAIAGKWRDRPKASWRRMAAGSHGDDAHRCVPRDADGSDEDAEQQSAAPRVQRASCDPRGDRARSHRAPVASSSHQPSLPLSAADSVAGVGGAGNSQQRT